MRPGLPHRRQRPRGRPRLALRIASTQPRARGRCPPGQAIYNQAMYPPDDGRDVIGNGDQRDRPAWRPGWAGRSTTALTAAALAVGLIAGYLAGHRPGGAPEPSPPPPSRPAKTATAPTSQQPTTTTRDVYPALIGTGNRCAVQRGTTLQLGVEIANQWDHAVVVGRFRAVLPIGGLRATAASVGTCGALPAEGPTSRTLPADATEWLTITFHVLVRCPQPLPVQFLISYADSGHTATVQLDEFPDLGQVSYNQCPSTQ